MTDTEPLTDKKYLALLCHVGYELWSASLAGGSPNNHKRFDRMNKPQPGDLVMETTTGILRLFRNTGDVGFGIGTLVSIEREPYPRAEDEPPWDEAAEGKPEPLEEVFYIRRLDTCATVRWTNAKFITILPEGGWKR